MTNLHDGHRARLKEKYIGYGMEVLSSVEALEMLLYFSIPRKNTNEIAHRLLNAFGSFKGVLDASVGELIKIEGVGVSTAVLIRMIPDICRKYMNEKMNNMTEIHTTEDAVDYISPRFKGLPTERLYMVCLDDKNKIINAEFVCNGSVKKLEFTVRTIVEYALRCMASKAILAHNHPTGPCDPTFADINTTKRLNNALSLVDVKLLDHIIIGDDEYVSLNDIIKFNRD